MVWRSFVWWTIALTLCVAVVLHFALILVKLIARADDGSVVSRVATAYVEPLFRQSWWLFAPDPPSFEYQVLIRCLCEDGGVLQVGAWHPLTDPLIASHQSNRLSPIDSRLTVIMFAAYSLGEGTLLRVSPEERTMLIQQWRDAEYQPTGLVVLERAGVALLEQTYSPAQLRAVQVKLIMTRIPKFDHRNEPSGSPEIEVEFDPEPLPEVMDRW